MTAVNRWRRFAVLFVLALLVAPAGCGKKDEPAKDTSKADNAPKPADRGAEPVLEPKPKPALEDLSKAKPGATFTADAFLAENKKDGAFLLNRYPDQVIELTGTLKGYGGGDNAGAVTLETKSNEPFDVIMYATADKQPWAKALPTQQVVLRGRVPPKGTVLPVVVWQFIEVKGAPLAPITAEQFARDRDADAAYFQKNEDRPVIITGVITKAEYKPKAFVPVSLKGSPGGDVDCVFGDQFFALAPFSEKQIAALKPGQTVKILGRCTALKQIRDCVLLEPAP